MILIRDIFYLKFGKAKDAKALLPELSELKKKFGFNKGRTLTDLVTSHSYTLILESEWKDIASWESKMTEGLGAAEWGQWYQKFMPLCDSAGREILNIME